MVQFNIHASIEPGIGLGGIKLRTHISEFFDVVANLSVAGSSQGRIRKAHAYLQAAYLIAYQFPVGITLVFNVMNGKLYKLVAGENYQGCLFGTLRVGMSCEEARLLEPRLQFDETEEVFVVEGVRGLAIETDGLNQRITEIIVHVTEFDDLFVDPSKTDTFARGLW